MAFKTCVIISALIIAVNSAPSPPPPCTCEEDEVYMEKIWEFYNSDVKANSNAALPAELSPIVYCNNCLENNRRKRKTETETDTERPEVPRIVAEVTEKSSKTSPEVAENLDDVDYSDDTRPGFEDPLCPAGTKRIGLWCA